MTDATDATKDDAKTTPPWGDDFDAARAWETIKALRAAEGDLKAKVKTFESAEAARADAAKTEEQRIADAAAKTASDLAAAKRDLFVERAVRKFGLDETLAEFLTGDDEDAILAKAERLSTLGKPAAKADGEDGDTPPVATRPAAALTPGHGGATTVSDDDAAKAAADAYRANR